MTTLPETLHSCKVLLPEEFYRVHQALWETEHIARLAARLLQFWQEGVPSAFPLPHFSVECTPPLAEVFVFFKATLAAWHQAGDKSERSLLQQFAEALVAAGCSRILILLGQRFTPASITDARAIPPTRTRLIAAVNKEYKQGLTSGARAWTKHAHRSSDKFWGEIKGSTADKNNGSLQLISRILDNTTWWNIFGHYAHDTVYEARVSTGHGVRWGKGGDELIGFLEPFDE